MYREAEIGCRRGWKQDLWEPLMAAEDAGHEQDEQLAAKVDRGRAEAWADSPPRQPEVRQDLLADAQSFNDDDLLDPRGTRDIREAIRRAREAKRRELHNAARREPQDQPILSGEQRSGEDKVLDVRPAPFERAPEPIVPPVSTDEIRKRVDEMRRQRRVFESPAPVHFHEDDERYTRPPELMQPAEPEQEPSEAGVAAESDYELRRPDTAFYPGSAPIDAPSFDERDDDAAMTPDQANLAAERSAPEIDGRYAGEFVADGMEPAEGWPEQAPWAQDEPPYEEWIEQRPKRRSWFGSLLHRHHAPAPAPATDPLLAWEPEAGTEADDELEPWDVPAESVAAEAAVISPAPTERSGQPVLPPLPYDADDDELGEDYLLADARFGDNDDEEQREAQVPRICATCRYFRPDGTCGNSFAFTFRRRVNEEYLSCASSIGSWWLPSDRYWESVVDFAHHGQPTPLLDRFAIQSDEQETDDEIHTP
jgi:hypothetical protein